MEIDPFGQTENSGQLWGVIEMKSQRVDPSIRANRRKVIEEFQFDPDLNPREQKSLEELKKKAPPSLFERLGEVIQARRVRRNPSPRKRGAKVIGFKDPDRTA